MGSLGRAECASRLHVFCEGRLTLRRSQWASIMTKGTKCCVVEYHTAICECSRSGSVESHAAGGPACSSGKCWHWVRVDVLGLDKRVTQHQEMKQHRLRQQHPGLGKYAKAPCQRTQQHTRLRGVESTRGPKCGGDQFLADTGTVCTTH